MSHELTIDNVPVTVDGVQVGSASVESRSYSSSVITIRFDDPKNDHAEKIAQFLYMGLANSISVSLNMEPAHEAARHPAIDS